MSVTESLKPLKSGLTIIFNKNPSFEFGTSSRSFLNSKLPILVWIKVVSFRVNFLTVGASGSVAKF